jgi:serine/threonine protein kinase
MSGQHDKEFPELPRFDIRRKLGAGGMGEVYEAFDKEQNSVVALKLLRKLSPRALGLLKSEFRSVVNVRDRNLVRLRELGLHEGEWFITMEYVDGVNFLDWVRPLRTPPLGDDD